MQPGYKARDVVGMRADVAEATAGPALRGIRAPGGLFLSGVLKRGGQPVLRVFDLHDANLSELAVGDHLAGLADHRIARVIVRESENQPVWRTMAARSSASSSEVVIGLSQITWKPASRNALAIG